MIILLILAVTCQTNLITPIVIRLKQYLKTQTNQSCKFEEVTNEDILTILNKLDNKSSSDKYDISNKILKYIKH